MGQLVACQRWLARANHHKNHLGRRLRVSVVIAVMAGTSAVSSALPGFPHLEGSAAAAGGVSAPWTPDGSASGFKDNIQDYSTAYQSGEFGIDVGLSAGTPIYAPEAGTVTYVQNGCAWSPGRLILRLDRGPVVAFGHVYQPVLG